ncbi:O-antigen ligase family protein [Ureibacillus sp. GCM10028918]|uniref:O-antigen ligase family protein n=1 Tax=Ureibacillus sp. GCM10028918 TaxID=3273429 RepID=UPI00361F5765
MNIFKPLISGEVWFVLFLFSGAFKESLNLQIDIAIVFFILTFFSVVFRFVKNPTVSRYSITPLVLFSFLLCVIIISYLFTLSTLYADEKIVKFLVLTVPSFLFPFILIRDKESLIRFLSTIGILSFILSIISLPIIFQKGSELGFVGFNGGNYQGLARINGIGLIVLLIFGLFRAKSKLKQLFYLIASIIVSFSLLGTGSRMPLIAFTIVLIYFVVSSFRIVGGKILYRKELKFALILAPLLTLILTFLGKDGYFNSILYRFQVLFSNDGGDSTEARMDRFLTAFEIWRDYPIFGGGIGSFGILYHGLEYSDYPHNIFLEFLSEQGLIGFMIICLLFLLVVYRGLIVYRKKQKEIDIVQLVLFSCYLYYFFNSLVSGDINGNRVLFTFLAILSVSPYLRKTIENHKSQKYI